MAKPPRVLNKINAAIASGRGVYLNQRDLRELAGIVHEQGDRACRHEAMLHAFVQRAYGQASLEVH